MKTIRHIPCVFVVAGVAVSSLRALGDDNSPGRPLVQVSFDRLIPTAYPTVPPNYGRLHQITFNRLIASSYPTVQPDFGRLQQTTFIHLVPTSFPAVTLNVVGPVAR